MTYFVNRSILYRIIMLSSLFTLSLPAPYCSIQQTHPLIFPFLEIQNFIYLQFKSGNIITNNHLPWSSILSHLCTQPFSKHLLNDYMLSIYNHSYQVLGVGETKSLALKKLPQSNWEVQYENGCKIVREQGCSVTENKYELSPGAQGNFS